MRSENFVLYLPNAHHILPITAIQNGKYLPLLEVLGLVGKVNALHEKKNSIKIGFGTSELELHLNEAKIRLNKNAIVLRNPVTMANGQWMVPVDFLTTALTPLTHQPIEFQPGANRIFIGDFRPNSFSLRLDKLANGSRLTVQFADKIAINTSSSNGQWIISLGDRPVEPLEPSFRFQDPYVSEVRFDDHDGLPKLVVTPAAAGLNFLPVLAESGKVLLADVLKPPAQAAEQNPPPEPPKPVAPSPLTPPPPPESAESAAQARAEAAGVPLHAIVLDAGHGGDDTGVRSRDGVFEKDLVAQLVANVRLALVATKKYRVILTRVGDANVSFDQRETAANLARTVDFLTFHAGRLGTGTPSVAVYVYQPPFVSRSDTAGPRALFTPWVRVQENHLDQSRQLAQALRQQLGQVLGLTGDSGWQAPVRSLRSIDAPAAAIEIGSLSSDADAGILVNASFQQQIAAAVAKAIEALAASPS